MLEKRAGMLPEPGAGYKRILPSIAPYFSPGARLGVSVNVIASNCTILHAAEPPDDKCELTVHPREILAEADRCVKCGYCLPHCPTYMQFLHEGDSPRGRIALIQGALDGILAGDRLQMHLDRCLLCRACETACPSGVRYGKLLIAARALQQEPLLRRQARRLQLALLSHLPYLYPANWLAYLLQRSGLPHLATLLGGKVRRSVALLPPLQPPVRWLQSYPPDGNSLGRVGLFTGCVSRVTEQRALQATITLLNHLGIEVIVPAAQGCCGAMHQSAGDEIAASSMAQHNHQIFAASGIDTIVTVASGCGAQLAESGGELTVADISSYLLGLPGIGSIELQPLKRRVALHTPCSLKNVLDAAAGPLHLLQSIPDIELFPLPDNGLCCGGAGHYLLTQPDIADALRQDKLNALRESRAEILVTSNSGCALHLAAGIRKARLNIEILHPVELLARQLRP